MLIKAEHFVGDTLKQDTLFLPARFGFITSWGEPMTENTTDCVGDHIATDTSHIANTCDIVGSRMRVHLTI